MFPITFILQIAIDMCYKNPCHEYPQFFLEDGAIVILSKATPDSVFREAKKVPPASLWRRRHFTYYYYRHHENRTIVVPGKVRAWDDHEDRFAPLGGRIRPMMT